MASVAYMFDFGYLLLGAHRCPALLIEISSPFDPTQAVETDAYLDSGASVSLFDGRFASSVGLDLLSGPEKRYRGTSGAEVIARMHRVRILHETLGSFELEVGFSTGEISRNLLGRDFFNCVQIGFRERQHTFYVTPTP